MSKLKFSFLVLMLMVSVSASADWAPADVQAALKKMYPTADDVAWSHDESYYVADFLMNGFDTKVWFDGHVKTSLLFVLSIFLQLSIFQYYGFPH